MAWMDDVRARTDESGRFLTPALLGTGRRRLKAWLVDDGLHEVVQVDATPPERGTTDVGVLRPLAGIVTFEAGSPVGEAAYRMTVAAGGERVDTDLVLGEIPFAPDGRIRLAGLPPGNVDYLVVDPDGSAVARGSFRATGGDVLVKMPPFRALKEPEPEGPPVIVAIDGAVEDPLVLLLRDDGIVSWKRGAVDRFPDVPAGEYRVLLSAGDRVGSADITHDPERETRVSVAVGPLGRTAILRVLRDGAPVPGAEVFVRGFRRGARGQRVPWARTGDDGRATLFGLPPAAEALEVTVLKDGSGRSYGLDLGGDTELEVDLARP
jgi:hypothetical protein